MSHITKRTDSRMKKLLFKGEYPKRYNIRSKAYKVFKIGKVGSKFYTTIYGKNFRTAWEEHKRAGTFISGDYIVEDRKGKDHRFRH